MDPRARPDGHALPETNLGHARLNPSKQLVEDTTNNRSSRVKRRRIALFTATSAVVLCLLFFWGGSVLIRLLLDPFGREAAAVDLATSLNGATAYHVSHDSSGTTALRVDVQVPSGLSNEARGHNLSSLQMPPAYVSSMAPSVQVCVYDEDGAYQMSMTQNSKCAQSVSDSWWRPAWLPHWV